MRLQYAAVRSYEAGRWGTMDEKRKKKIAEHLKEMPPIYRATYKKAVAGKSLRATVNSFCAECTMWQREEVRRCTSLACQLYPYRPYRDKAKRGSKNTSEDANFGVESENSGKGDNHAG